MSATRSPLDAYLRGDASAAVTVAELLLSTHDPQRVVEAIDAAEHRSRNSADARRRLRDLRTLLDQHREGCGTVVRMLNVIEGAGEGDRGVSDIEGRIERCASMFDVLVGQSEASSVALYSLGSADLLDTATDEVVARMRQLGVLAPDRRVLQIGCGTGRFEEKLSASVAEVHGVDISTNMIEASRKRCQHLGNVHFSLGSGRDLKPYGAAHFDLVYAVDSMPYIVEVGGDVAARYFAEAARVLKHGGALLLYNYSYRGDALADDRDVVALADESGFDVVICGAGPFTFWNGREYLLCRVAA